MSGISINPTPVIFVLCVIACNLVVCNREYSSSDTHGFLRRFYRSDNVDHKAAHPLNAPTKPSPSDKQNDIKVSPASNSSVTDKVTPKSGDSKPDSHVNQPVEEKHDNILTVGTQHNLNQGALLRGFYVFVGLSAIVVIYIVVKTISVRRKKSTVRKYGILTNREDVEMTPLGADDEEEDTTLFDVSNQTRP